MRTIGLLLEILPSPPRHWLLYLWNLYPPFFFSGIRIRRVAPDLSSAETTLRLHWWNRNYVGTLFGGSLYAMCDPMHMVLLMELLGPAYLVRDKGAKLRFLRKGTGRVSARFEISSREVAEIWSCPDTVQERSFLARVTDEEGEIVCEVEKILHIRRCGAGSS